MMSKYTYLFLSKKPRSESWGEADDPDGQSTIPTMGRGI